MTIPPPLAFGFANAAILGWLAAAAAPILIHLWMKRVRRETEWAAVRFLRRAIERHSRRLRLREWLLLAVRTAIILCVVLAAAKPVLEGLGLAGPGVRTHYVLAIDASLSMRYRTDDGTLPGSTLLDGAKRLAGELIDNRRSGDLFSLIVMSDPPRPVVAQATSDASRVRRAIASIEPTDGGADLQATLVMARQQIEQARSQTASVDRREVVVFSDLARHTWGAVAGDGASKAGGSAATQAVEELAKLSELSVIDLGVDGARNAFITRVAIDDPLPTAGRPLRVTATARVVGPAVQQQATQQQVVRTAELLVNGSVVATKRITLPASGTATLPFTHRFDRPGAQVIGVRLGTDSPVGGEPVGDRLPADDIGWLGATLPARTRVLCVAGGPDAARYLANALRPSGEARGESPIDPVVISDAELATIDLTDYAAVFVCNVAQLSDGEAERLAAYARGGGGVVFFLGDRVLPAAYNRHARGGPGQGGLGQGRPGQSRARQGDAGHWVDGATVPLVFVANESPTEKSKNAPLLPITIDKPVDSTSYVIDPLDYAHPIVSPFEGRERAGLLTTPIARYWRLVLDKDADRAEVALAAASGNPLLVTSAVGRGRVAVVATAASLASVNATTGEPWTVMPAWPSFLPIVRGLLNHVVGGDGEQRRVVVGDSISATAPAGVNRIEIMRPDQRVAPAPIDASRGWSYDSTDQAGVYLARTPGRSDPLTAIAVNFSPTESDPSRVAAKALPENIKVRRVAGGPTDGDALPTSTGVHRALLLTALVLVLIETALAYWFGRPPA